MSTDAQTFPVFELVGIVVCLFASAFFSGSETALTRLSDTRANHLIENEPGRYGILRFWLDSRRRILATLLVGNNLVNILCSVLAYRTALFLLPAYAEALSVFGLTIVVLIFAEITPKSLALHYSDKIVVPILYLVWVFDKLLFVAAAPLSKIPQLIIGRVAGESEMPPVTEDEIEYQIRLGHNTGVFEEQKQGDLLMSVVEFSETQVKEVMVPRTDVFGLEEDSQVAEAIDAVIENGHSRIPVYKDNLDSIVGLLYSKDLLRQLQQGSELESTIADLVRKPPFFAPQTQKISDLLTEMRRRGLHMAIVVDEFGGTSGLITLEDIIEELVGEIRDEFDEEEAMVRRVDKATWIVDARLSIHDLKGATGIELPDTRDYESVGGFVVASYGSIPAKLISIDTTVVSGRLRLTVLASDDRHVERLELRLMPSGDAEQDDA